MLARRTPEVNAKQYSLTRHNVSFLQMLARRTLKVNAVVFFIKYSTNTNGTEEQVARKQ